MIKSESARNIINFIVFQVGWTACVVYPGVASISLVLVFLIFHFSFISQRRWLELQFVGMGTLVGSLVDGMWLHTGVMVDQSGSGQPVPLWLIGIWAMFLTTICHSLSWIGKKPWLPWVCAPIAGPFAYWSASKIGVVSLPDLPLSLAALALGWIIVFPLLLFVRRTVYTELTQ